MPESAALSRRVSEDVLTAAVRQRAARPEQQQNAAITANPVYQLMMEEAKSPEEKRDAVAAFLTFPGTKEESRARVQAYQEFEEYLQAVRSSMAEEIIKLTDTETFSELQAVYNDLNNALIEFDDRMRPLTDIVEALYTLRTEGKTFDAFREIKADREHDEQRRIDHAAKEREFETLNGTIKRLTGDIAALGEKKGWFGLSSVTEAARQEIARKDSELATARGGLEALQRDLQALERQGPGTSSLGEFSAQKDKLRELLDISSDEHKRRQVELVAAARNFLDTAKARIGEVRTHLGAMTTQVDHLYDANAKMSSAYAVLTDGVKTASEDNRTLLTGLQPSDGSVEPMIARMAREEKTLAIQEHLTALTTAGAHTTETYADLQSQAIRIKTMRDSTQAQIEKARAMGTQGIAGVADRLSVVLQAVSSAALGESSAMARDTLTAMVDSTNRIAQKETIRVAMGVSDANQEVLKAIDDLGAYGEVVRTATDISRTGLSEMRDNLERIKELAESVRADVHESVAVGAGVGSAVPSSVGPAKPVADPFGLGVKR